MLISFHMKFNFLSYANEDQMSTRTRFEKEAKGNLEMPHSKGLLLSEINDEAHF